MNVDIYKIIYESNWYDNNGIPVRFVSDNIQFWESNGEVTIDGNFVCDGELTIDGKFVLENINNCTYIHVTSPKRYHISKEYDFYIKLTTYNDDYYLNFLDDKIFCSCKSYIPKIIFYNVKLLDIPDNKIESILCNKHWIFKNWMNGDIQKIRFDTKLHRRIILELQGIYNIPVAIGEWYNTGNLIDIRWDKSCFSHKMNLLCDINDESIVYMKEENTQYFQDNEDIYLFNPLKPHHLVYSGENVR